MASATVINDHYTLEEYVRRRAGFLDKHPEYRHLQKIFPICRRDANDVFRNASEVLSVQEIQRREIFADIDPVLPLPTTNNTQTLNSFASYPDREWSPGLEAANNTHPRQQTEGPPFSPLTATSATSATSLGRRHRPANLIMPGTIALEPGLHAQQGQIRPTDPVLMSKILAALGRPPSAPALAPAPSPTPPSPPTPAINSPLRSPASSLSGRGMQQPVKQQRGTKRSATEPLDRGDSVLHDTPPAPPTTAPAHATANNASSHAVSQTDSVAAASSSPKKVRLNLKGPRRDPTTSPSPPAATKPVQRAPRKQPSQKQPARPAAPTRHLEKVIAGIAVAKNKAEAREASSIRHQRLLDEYKTNEDITTDIAEADKPDFMPEFFNPAAFASPENEVRCVCGVSHDDKSGDYIGCEGEGCQVWQHQRCVGSALPKNLNTGTYYCQMCDPWAHRHLIQDLRREATN